MSSLGSITCTFVRGQPPRPKQRLHVWTVPGLDGYGAMQYGQNDQEFQVVAVFYSDSAGVQAFRLAVEALQGQVVAITNDFGQTSNCFIVKIAPSQISAALAPGGITQRIEIQIAGVVLP